MNRKQESMLLLLKEFDEICRSNDITYTLSAGTMLGTVRHRGFIPWDDDADVMITKANFDKLKLFFEKHTIENRAFVHRWNNDKYPMIIARYYATENTGLQRAVAWDYMPAGQYIDVIIMIPLPVEPKKKDRIMKRIMLYVELNNEFYTDNPRRGTRFTYQYMFWNFLKRILGKGRVLRWFERSIFSCSDETRCREYMISHGIGSVVTFLKEHISNPVYVDFEDTKLPVPEKYMELFWYGYGSSWRIMPPVSERGLHQLYDDFNRPYQIYVSDYMRFIDQKHVFRAMKKYKDYAVIQGEKGRKINGKLRYWMVQHYALEIRKRIQQEHLDLDQLVCQEQYRTIDQIFEKYYNFQLSKITRHWQIFIALEDDLLAHACRNLIYYKGAYYHAKYILGLRQREAKPMTPALTSLKEVIEQIEALYYALDFQSRDEARKRIDECDEREYRIDFVLADLRLRSETLAQKQDYEELVHLAKRMIRRFPDSWDIYKYVADGYLGLGKKEEAAEIYDIVETMTANGETRLDIVDRKSRFS